MTRDPRVFAITRPDPARGDPQHPYSVLQYTKYILVKTEIRTIDFPGWITKTNSKFRNN